MAGVEGCSGDWPGEADVDLSKKNPLTLHNYQQKIAPKIQGITFPNGFYFIKDT